MYSDVGFEPRNIGDVDVIWHEGQFHLFHLVLPNHDFIAHAVSDDGLNWHRVDNALFIGHPGAWDDDALWTMNISADPDRPGKWRMFYTGLSRSERGMVQRVGLATSDDLYKWEKVQSEYYPLDVAHGGEAFYESSVDEGRKWVSFRDPLFFADEGRRYLLVSGRVKHGPLIRRGCVAVVEEVERDKWEYRKPLYHPGRYDDVEVPGLFKLGAQFYLIGSIREDVKVRYWYADTLDGPWRNYFDNVLLPQGNYAARTCVYAHPGEQLPKTLDTGAFAGHERLVFNFYFTGDTPGASKWGQGRNLMPPPKRLVVHPDGRLMLKSFEGFDTQVASELHAKDLAPLDAITDNPDSEAGTSKSGLDAYFGSDAGFETFLMQGNFRDFRMRGTLRMHGRGKCGIVFRHDQHTTSGYYLSLDLIKGLAQLRSWSAKNVAPDSHEGVGEHAFGFRAIQTSNFLTNREGPWDIELLAYGRYIEFSIDGYVRLSCVDDSFRGGRMGFYTETAQVRLDDLVLQRLRQPNDEAPALTE